jgi:small subunit ribosomal protein S3Ae
MKQKKVVKVRKKHWFGIVAPNLFNNQLIGESLVYDQRELLNRNITVNLMNLTHDPKTQQINIGFKMSELKGDKVSTEVVHFQVLNSSIRRMVRRGSTRIDETMICETADHKHLIVKAFIVTKAHVQSSKATTLRKMMLDYTTDTIKKMTYEQFVESLVSFKLKKDIKAVLNKVYPIRACEIREFLFATEKDLQKRRPKPKAAEEKPKEEPIADSIEEKKEIVPETPSEENQEDSESKAE